MIEDRDGGFTRIWGVPYLWTMLRGTLRTLRYGRSWLTDRARVDQREVELDRPDRKVRASLLVPTGRPGTRPSWVVLHGVTRPGRHHSELVRFARSLAATGAVVIVPDVPEWRELKLAPEATLPTVLAAVQGLRDSGLTDGRPPGLVGFSFGAPQALIASTRPGLAGELGCVAGFGGYCDLERTIRFHLTGRHEWEGREHYVRPDPYGRWVVASNLLTRIPGMGDATDVAEALRTLAVGAGERRVEAWDPSYDPVKRELRSRVAPARREVFDLFAPPADREPDPADAEPFVEALVSTAREMVPLMEPGPGLEDVEAPVHLVHGRNDRLIPFTESLRTAERLPGHVRSTVTVTRLFSHAKGDDHPPIIETVGEALKLGRALGRIFSAV